MKKSLRPLIIASVLMLTVSCAYDGAEFTEYDDNDMALTEDVGARAEAITPASLPEAWTTVASAGTVDDSDVGLVNLIGSTAQFKGTAPSSESILIRYNVTATAGIDAINDRITVRYRDNGPDARVVVSLLQLDLDTGLTTTLATFDSNAFPGSSSIQTQVVNFGGCWFNYDFAANAYFIEALLTRTTESGRPTLSAIQLSGFNLC